MQNGINSHNGTIGGHIGDGSFPAGALKERFGVNIGARPKKIINDLSVDGKYSEHERRARCELATCYRLIDLHNWSQVIVNHISFRLDDDDEAILINPFGLMYHEISAASLVKVNLEGKTLDGGSTAYGINQAGYVLHSAVHAARPDVRCAIHIHNPAVTAVSSMKCGLLPLSQEAMLMGEVAYHDYEGIFIEEFERELLAKDLGYKRLMLLRNHGLVACGRTIQEALFIVYNTVLACEAQVKVMSCVPYSELVFPKQSAIKQAAEMGRSGAGGVNRVNDKVVDRERLPGEMEWNAWVRALDDMGLETGCQILS